LRRNDDTAAELLPLRLIMSVVLIAALGMMVMLAAGSLKIFFAEQSVDQQCHDLLASLGTMVVDGAFRDIHSLSETGGTKRVFSFQLPDSLMYFCIGGDPDPLDTGHLTTELLEDGAVIVYKIQGGSKHVMWLPTETYHFRLGVFLNQHWTIAGEEQSLLICHGGKVRLVFECVQQYHQHYLLVHQLIL
jgi:hypothetical protein